MFSNLYPLHDRTRRRICRAVFIAVCLAPTVGVAAWIVSSHLPSHRSALETRWSQRLGLRVSVEGVKYPRPGLTRLSGLEISDPETGAVVAALPTVEIIERSGATVLRSESISVDAEHLPDLRKTLEHQFRWGVERPFRFHIGQVKLRGRTQSLASVQASLEPTENSAQASLSFRLADSEQDKPIQIRVVSNPQSTIRNPQSEIRNLKSPSVRWELNTGPTPLPCSWLTDLNLSTDMFGRDGLGADAWFSGYVWVTQNGDGWEAEFTGQLGALRLENLVPQESANSSSGPAHLWIERARVVNGRISDATFTFSAGPGKVDSVALHRWIAELGLQTIALPPARGSVPFDQIAFRVALDAAGANLYGSCPGAPEGTILVSDRRAMLIAPRTRRQELSAVVRAIAPRGAEFVPTTETAQRLTRWLPMSQLDATSASTARRETQPPAAPGSARR